MKLSQKLHLGSANLAEARVLPHFVTGFRDGNARLGEFRLSRTRLKTPALFPVFNMLTGPAKGGLGNTGGIFKFLKKWVLLEQRFPSYLSEVLHFTDFNLSPSMLDRWLPRDRSKTIHDWVNEWFLGEGVGPGRLTLFSDSGGFRLLFNSEMDVERFGVRPTPASILDLQLRYGADIVASLDYPLPPNTPPPEEVERSRRSLANALELLRLLEQVPETDVPFPYLAVHGQTTEGIRRYVQKLLRKLHSEGFTRPFGIAVGSLVPRRANYETIVALVHAALDELHKTERFDPGAIPVHVFGVTGDMIPVLSFLGVDSFDSSSHVQSARALGYYEPETWRPVPFRQLDDLPCDCAACAQMRVHGLADLKSIMDREGRVAHRSKRTREPLLKSQIYAWIAWHNLLLHSDEVETTRRAIFDGDLIEHVVRFGTARPRAQKLLSYLGNVDPQVQARLEHVPISLFQVSSPTDVSSIGAYSLAFTPDDFDVGTLGYRPAKRKEVLLLLPCSAEKPYSQSRSHQLVTGSLKKAFGKRTARIERVSVSGLYGPVPEEFEELDQVAGYNYYLTSSAHKQIALVTERLARFLQEHRGHFSMVVGYATSRAYRRVMQDAFAQAGTGTLLPRSPTSLSHTEFARTQNLSELVGWLCSVLPATDIRVKSLVAN